MQPSPAWTDQQIDNVIGNLLRSGIIVSDFIVLFGGILYLTRHGVVVPDYRLFRGEPTDLRHISGIIKDAIQLKPTGVIELGLLILISTPILRVAFTIVAFALQRDRMFVLVTAIVFAVLLFGLLGAAR
jgi:uncharacterized membrane protein